MTDSALPRFVCVAALLSASVLRLAAAAPNVAVAEPEQRCREQLAGAVAALKSRPDEIPMLMQQGVSLTCLNRGSEAMAVFRKVAALEPGMAAAHNNIAVLLAGEGRFDEARVSLERALRTQEAYAAAHENLGALYAHWASEAYRKALKTDREQKTGKPRLMLAGVREAGLTPVKPVAPVDAPGAAGVKEGAAPVRPVAPDSAQAPAPSAQKPKAEDGQRSAPQSGGAVVPKPEAKAEAKLEAKPEAKAEAKPEAKAEAKHEPRPESRQPAGRSTELPAEAEVKSALLDWAAAWSRQDMRAYESAYMPDFKGSLGSHADWLRERSVRIVPRTRIDVRLSAIAVTVKGDSAEAGFEQLYASDGRSIKSRKSVHLQRVRGRWLIREESGR